MGHKKTECPKLLMNPEPLRAVEGKKDAAKTKARAFTITAEEAKAEPDVVSGTFLVNKVPATVLFDSGASRSFVSVKFCKLLDKGMIEIEKPFTVDTAIGEKSRITEVLEGCEIELEDHKLPLKLCSMNLKGFDVVLGMDWLAKNGAQIVCNKKMVQLQTPEVRLIVVHGDRDSTATKIVSMMKAQKYMMHGCEAYLAYVVDTKMEPKKLEDVPVVREIPDVFPDDLSGIPPDREIEFRIDLMPGAKPVAKAPYRLAPSEMKELMA